MPPELKIHSSLWKQVVADVKKRRPEEACGLLAGVGTLVLDVIPLENMYHSPTRYRIEPQEQLAAFQYIEEKGWDLIAIYHSHPAGPGHPSSTDVSEAYYPEAVYIIVSKEGERYRPRGFIIRGGQVQEISILIEKQK